MVCSNTGRIEYHTTHSHPEKGHVGKSVGPRKENYRDSRRSKSPVRLRTSVTRSTVPSSCGLFRYGREWREQDRYYSDKHINGYREKREECVSSINRKRFPFFLDFKVGRWLRSNYKNERPAFRQKR